MSAPASAKHVPERSCAACRRKRPQGELTRLGRVDGVWTVQPRTGQTGRLRPGRGSYVCADTPACWIEKRLRRALGAQASDISRQLQASSPKSAME